MTGPFRSTNLAQEGGLRRGMRTSQVSRRQHSVAGISDLLRSDRGGSNLPSVRSSPELRALAGGLATLRDNSGQETVVMPWTKFPSAEVVKDAETDRKAEGGEAWHPSMGWKWMPHHLSKESLWQKIRQEAKDDAEAEPTLASTLHSTVLVHQSFEKTMAFILANKLASTTLLGTHLMRLCQDAYEDDPDMIDAYNADLQAVFDRDPACDRYTQCMLYFKGFQAVQSHRIAHWLWGKGRKALALAIQSRVSEVFHVDIHPAAQIGRGVLMDHATGVVVGETAVVGDNVSMLHHVTLGGSGTGKGVRHPHIGHGVLIGAGATLLGGIHVGCGTKIGAGTVVVSDLPCHAVAVGVPAKIIKTSQQAEPCINMDQCSDFTLNFQI